MDIIDTIKTRNGGSFVVRCDTWTVAEMIYGIFRQHANGGGFNRDWVFRTEDGWRVEEKHRDGGQGLARALVKLPLRDWEITDDAIAEMELRKV